LEVGRLLRRRGIPHAFIDVDALAYTFPTPPDDRFQQRLALRNLAEVWRNHQQAGARVLVLDRVVEHRANLAGYRAAVPGAAITVVRLSASVEVIAERLERRGDPQHLDRAQELVSLMDAAKVEDLLVNTEGRTPTEVGLEILTALRWPPKYPQ
jgi:chloramphenicol 3-O-phosphotransferase